MQRCFRVVGKRTQEVIVQRRGQRSAVIRSPADIEHHLNQGIVHGHGPFTITRASSRRVGGNGLAECDRHVFDEMMTQVAGGLHVEVDAGIARKGDQHMIEKRVTGFDARRAGARCDRNADLRFLRLANDDGHAPNSSARRRASSTPV